MSTMSAIYRKHLSQVNWELLIFLILIMNVKLVVKITAIILVCFLNRKQLLSRQAFQQKFIWFYIAMIVLTGCNVLLHLSSFSLSYLFSVGFGTVFWLFAALAAYFNYIVIKNEDTEKLHHTITAFFILHCLFVLCNLLLIMIETGSINPYTYKGLNQKYFVSTGDFIRGITLDNSVTTAFISVFGVMFFLFRRKLFLSVVCMACLLLSGSNITNFMLMGTFIYMFLFHSDRIQKSMIIVYVMMIIIFLGRISPQNGEYIARPIYKLMGKTYDIPVKTEPTIDEKPDSLLTSEERRTKFARLFLDSVASLNFKPVNVQPAEVRVSASSKPPVKETPVIIRKVPVGKIDSQFYRYKETADLLEKRSKYIQFLNVIYTRRGVDSLQKKYDWNKPGKLIAFRQLFDFYQQHPMNLPLGTGIGNFSSRLAFKATALGIAGSYPKSFRYVHPYFRDNYLYTYLYYHSLNQMKHSAVNVPDSVYGQLLGEYGIAGFLSFIILYAGWFLRRARYVTYGIPLLILLAGAFFVEYWFEQLSIVILFELLFLLDIKSNSHEITAGLHGRLSIVKEGE